MNRQVPIDGHAGLVKDLESGAVLNNDVTALEARLRERERVRKASEDHDRIGDLERRVAELEAFVFGNRNA